ncbi:PadR family transcriptional regulator [Pyrofollis japonicus]|uniref:PadR family transcriptional regulator n=1 Tax=Pyrofollis japonicus TaxID=3060460 RepID=UPI00295B5297|nr:PadR family transcriptional regulator [Pyrofollis japonicus]BEP16863.1 PadR family transcriptional regulator [Pyrofollis japonicus]
MASAEQSEAEYLERAVEMRTRYMVLLLLAEGPKSGYEIIKRIRSLLAEAGEGGASPGTVYPVLRSLEEEGLIESSEEPRGARQRKVYRITEKGAEYLMRSAEKALNILDIALRLHLAAVRGVKEPIKLSPELRALLSRIIEQLKSIKARTEELIEAVEKFLS